MHLKKLKKGQHVVLALVLIIISILLLNYLVQRFWVHRDGFFVPDYEKVTLTEESDYETIFLQTGLGKSAVDKLLEQDDFQAILDAQDVFFAEQDVECKALLGWFTREDRLSEKYQLVDLQPGDVLLTTSTHSVGWRHGHAALVLDEYTTLECAVWGQNSCKCSVSAWKDYSNVLVLRMKDTTAEERQAVVDYALENLEDVPYHISSGFLGPKAPETDASYFGLHCTYLVWYAWYQFGYDIDSDGGRLVSAQDILDSDMFEVVQVYGMDPREFIE